MIDMMQKMFMFFLCACFPWLVLLLNDNPGGALVALVMQVTFIGWPFATIWAWRTNYPPQKNKKEKIPKE